MFNRRPATNQLRRILGLTVAVAIGAASAITLQRAGASGAPAAGALTYRGTLELADGSVVVGDKPIGLALWDSMTAGKKLANCDVPSMPRAVVQGNFEVKLPDTCTAAISGSADLWVEVQVDGLPLPRTKLGAVPYAVEATHAASAANADGTLASALSALQADVASLKAAPHLTTIHGEVITAADDASTGGFAGQCLGAGKSGTDVTLHACSLAANRKCSALGYSAGLFVGESDGTFLSIICIK